VLTLLRTTQRKLPLIFNTYGDSRRLSALQK